MVRFWRSKAKVTAGRRVGEGMQVEDGASNVLHLLQLSILLIV